MKDVTSADASEQAPRNWKVGDVIADRYEVTGVLGERAFGIVHKVHHRGWDMDLVAKTPNRAREAQFDAESVSKYLTGIRLGGILTW